MIKPFTYDYYRYVLNQLKKKYRFISFNEGKEIYKNSNSSNNTDSYIIMRHDIDMDLSAAASLASIENEFGIEATYFVMVRCPIYNVFSQIDSESISQILSYGHHLGLHFDCAIYPDISMNNIESTIDKECNVLKLFFDREIESISFHRPGPLELSNVVLKKYPNTYERMFLEYFSYYSDSRSIWAIGNPVESDDYKNGKNLHICIHPVWWRQNEEIPFKRLVNVVDSTNKRAESYMEKNCSVWNEGKATYK